MPEQAILRSFVSGEVTPRLRARADLVQYVTGSELVRNFLIDRRGAALNRAGWAYVASTKSNGVARLVEFIFEADDQTYLLEVGAGYIRFFWHGAAVVDGGGLPIEVATPYAASELFELDYAQSTDTITIVHPNHAPRELKRVGHDTWTLTVVSWATALQAPTGLAGTAAVAGTRTLRYLVTAYAQDTLEESLGSAILEIPSAEFPTVDAPQPIDWDALAGAGGFYVYADHFENGIFGFIGEASDPQFNDVGFAADYTITPPTERQLFISPGDYPSSVTYHGQRRFFGRSTNKQEHIWGSRVGAYANFNISTPLQDDDSVTLVLASRHINPPLHLVSLSRLLVMTDEAEWIIRGDQEGTITPTTFNADPVGYVGSAPYVRPEVIGNRLVFAPGLSTGLNEIGYQLEPQVLAGRSLTEFAEHLFRRQRIVDMSYARVPHSILWCVRDDGVLLGLTHVADQDVLAWHRHTTAAGGQVESVCAIPDTTAGETVVYLVVKRTINGSDVRYIERMASRQIVDLAADAFFVDAGLSYSGSPITTVTGLAHLEGEAVAVLADGVATTATVSGGQITLATAASDIHVGLAIPSVDLQPNALDVQGSSIRGKRKRVQAVIALLEDSTPNFKAGPDTAHLRQAFRERWDSSTGLVTGQKELNLDARWVDEGKLVVRNDLPLPLTILGLILDVEIGG